MSDPLQAYHAELRAPEDDYFNLHLREGGPIGVSMWSVNLDLLREIDARHGVQPDDPRVYSIAAYEAERRQIDQERLALCKAKKWDLPDLDESAKRDRFAALWRLEVRQADCLARHFPGLDCLDTRTSDGIPKLWAYLTECVSVIAERV